MSYQVVREVTNKNLEEGGFSIFFFLMFLPSRFLVSLLFLCSSNRWNSAFREDLLIKFKGKKNGNQQRLKRIMTIGI